MMKCLLVDGYPYLSSLTLSVVEHEELLISALDNMTISLSDFPEL
jgi:hypothetical protein